MRPHVVLLTLLSFGCAGPLQRGQRHLERGDLPAAARALRAAEPGAGELGPTEEARYSLYRGLAELGLGDLDVARRWLTRARRLERASPEVFTGSERGRLAAAWRSMGLLPGELPR